MSLSEALRKLLWGRPEACRSHWKTSGKPLWRRPEACRSHSKISGRAPGSTWRQATCLTLLSEATRKLWKRPEAFGGRPETFEGSLYCPTSLSEATRKPLWPKAPGSIRRAPGSIWRQATAYKGAFWRKSAAPDMRSPLPLAGVGGFCITMVIMAYPHIYIYISNYLYLLCLHYTYCMYIQYELPAAHQLGFVPEITWMLAWTAHVRGGLDHQQSGIPSNI